MAINISLNFKFKGVQWKSGHLYQFRYSSWRHDPQPSGILMYKVHGIHPRTKNQHRYLQMINLTYIPRPIRKQFAQQWVQEMERTNGNAAFTWQLVKRRFPGLKHAVRRYFIIPNYYITDIKPIPLEDMESVIISTWSKDFSKKLRTSLFSKYKKVMDRKKKTGGFMSRLFGR